MLSEKLYTLRRKNGLSQEQLAEKLGVSRQAVSKWESGQSIPELDKLQALSQYFQITIDQLLQDTPEPAPPPVPDTPHSLGWIGVFLCLLGGVGLVLFGLLTLLRPSSAQELNASSAITLNGSGILLGLFLLLMAAGVLLILRKK